VVANALGCIGAPKQLTSPLVQHLPKLWELVHHRGMTTMEQNPIRRRPGRDGRLPPFACDFRCGFDREDPRVARLGLTERAKPPEDEVDGGAVLLRHDLVESIDQYQA
jgi:hypothetical protein